MEIRDSLIVIRTTLEYDIPKAKQMLTNLIKDLEK